MYYWGGRLHNVPQGFKVPKMTLGSLITCWYCSDRRENIPPLIYVAPHDLPDRKNAKVLLFQWKKMITHVRRAAVVVGFRIPSNSNMNEGDTI